MQQRYQKGEEKKFLQEFQHAVNSAKNIVLTSHKNPDDDSISSLLGLYHALQRDYPQHTYHIAYTGQSTERWASFEGFEKIEFGVDPGSLASTDLIVMTDVSGWSRVSDLPQQTCKKIVIDHHKNEPDISSEGCCYIDPTASSCSELIYRLFYQDDALTNRLAEVILLGIIGDTGSFTYINPTQTEVFSIAERLVRDGDLNIQAMKARYMQYSETTFYLMQQLMAHFEIVHDAKWGKYSVSYLNRDEVKRFTDQDLDVNAASAIFVDSYSKSIKGVNWGFVVYPMLTENIYKVSMRSLPQGVNVRLIAEGLGNGGGHDLASGAKFMDSKSAEEVIAKIKSYLSSNTPHFYN